MDPKSFPAYPHRLEPGMTLRDHFAGLAMQAYISSPEFLAGLPADPEQGQGRIVSSLAYWQADAMLQARSA